LRQDDAEEPEEEPKSGPVARLFWELVDSLKDDFFIIFAGAIAALVRAMGVTVESGQTGLRFSFGRAGRELGPGFYPLIPFLQVVRKVPTRSRTLDLPAQRVATFEGLVYHVDANLVYRVTDVRKALIEIDNLEQGMAQMLGLGVQEVLRAADRSKIANIDSLNQALVDNLATRLAPWGVTIERAGFPSITPSPKTLRITQLDQVVGERMRMLDSLEQLGLERMRALTLMGTRVRAVSHTHHIRRQERLERRRRRLIKALMQRGWMKVQIHRAGQNLKARMSTRGTLKARANKDAKAPAKAKSRAKSKARAPLAAAAPLLERRY
jgi:regulator of protease activity HflC (stomatin/prohibitin superfamily)